MADVGHSVKLQVYDISRGLAQQLSEPLLGKKLEGVWHTGVFVYGKEYFYGSLGIEWCPLGGTILGSPDRVINMGETQIPEEIFNEYLISLKDKFSPGNYHLLEHNCNTFSADIATFLTGKHIPEYITNLPKEVMSTPFGLMLKPIIDSMSMRSPAQQSTQLEERKALPKNETKQVERSQTAVVASPHTETQLAFWSAKEISLKFVYLLDTSWIVSEVYPGSAEAKKIICQLQAHLEKPDSSPFPAPIIDLIGDLMSPKSKSKSDRQASLKDGLELLSLVVLSKKGWSHYTQKADHLIFRLVRSFGRKRDFAIDQALMELLCNLFSQDGGSYVVGSTEWKVTASLSTSNMDEAIGMVVERLSSEDSVSCWLEAAKLFHNIVSCRVPISQENEIGLVSSAVECANNLPFAGVARWLFAGLLSLIGKNSETAELVSALFSERKVYQQKHYWLDEDDYLLYLDFESKIESM
eukprot:m.6955 g.6955  ORF g.6955 m.6955 type:complete len:468 (+) comp17295_c0_seq2:127-1530(+)